jgi:hypothetical protein
MSSAAPDFGPIEAGRRLLRIDSNDLGFGEGHSASGLDVNCSFAPDAIQALDQGLVSIIEHSGGATNLSFFVSGVTPVPTYTTCPHAVLPPLLAHEWTGTSNAASAGYVGVRTSHTGANLGTRGAGYQKCWINWHCPPAINWGLESGFPSVDPHSTLSACLQLLRARSSTFKEDQTIGFLVRQLETLLQDDDELKASGISVSLPSLSRLVAFLAERKGIAHPSISITRLGHFAASWAPRKRAKLTLVFAPNGLVQWIAADVDARPPLRESGDLPQLPSSLAMWMAA